MNKPLNIAALQTACEGQSSDMQALSVASGILWHAYGEAMYDAIGEAIVRHARNHVDKQRQALLGREV
jgi:hypothetical protein